MRLPAIIVTFFLLAGFTAAGQKMPEDRFEEGSDALRKGNVQVAIAELGYLVRHEQGDRHYHESLSLLAQAYYGAGKYDSAIRLYRQVFADTPIVDGRDYVSDRDAYGYTHGDYIPDRIGIDRQKRNKQFEQDRHNAEHDISLAFTGNKQYDSAFRYAYMFDTLDHHLPGWVCGNGINYREIYYEQMLRYVAIFESMGKYKECEQAMMQAVFAWPQDSTYKRLEQMLRAHENIPLLKRQFKESIAHWYNESLTAKEATPVHLRVSGYSIRFFDTKLFWIGGYFTLVLDDNYSPVFLKGGKTNMEIMKLQPFYKWIMRL